MIVSSQVAAPIRYTNSMPSQTWPYHRESGTQQQRYLTDNYTTTEGQATITEVSSRYNKGSCAPEFDRRLCDPSPIGTHIMPHLVRPDSAEVMASEIMQNGLQLSDLESAHSLPYQQIQPFISPQAQTQHRLMASKPSANDLSRSPLVRFSSATEIDDHLLAMANTTGPMYSPPPSPSPAAARQARTLQYRPPQGFDFEPTASLSPSPWYQNTIETSSRKLIQPNDLIQAFEYDFLSDATRKQYNMQICQLWQLAGDSSDQARGANAAETLRSLSNAIHQQRQECLHQANSQAQFQQNESRNIYEYIDQQPLPLSSSLPFPTASSSPQMPHLPHTVVQQQSDISHQFREDIRAYLPKLFQCLRIVSATFEELPTDTTMAHKQRAQQWINDLRQTLSPETNLYVQQLLVQIETAAQKAHSQ